MEHPRQRARMTELQNIIDQFAEAMTAADARKPSAVSPRSGRTYQPGIGSHPEDRAVDLMMAELASLALAAARVLPGEQTDVRLVSR